MDLSIHNLSTKTDDRRSDEKTIWRTRAESIVYMRKRKEKEEAAKAAVTEKLENIYQALDFDRSKIPGESLVDKIEEQKGNRPKFVEPSQITKKGASANPSTSTHPDNSSLSSQKDRSEKDRVSVHKASVSTAEGSSFASFSSSSQSTAPLMSRNIGLQAFDLTKNLEEEKKGKSDRSLKFSSATFFDFNDIVLDKTIKKKRRGEIASFAREEDTALSDDTETNTKPRSASIARKCNETLRFNYAADYLEKNLIANNKNSLPWLEDHLESSSRSCSFTIPFDILDFKKMTVREYLSRYCRVSRQRTVVYQKFYIKGMEKLEKHIKKLPIQRLQHCITEVLQNLASGTEITRLIKLVELDKHAAIEFQDFCKASAVGERILFAGIARIPVLEKSMDPRNLLEQLDFAHFKTKVKDITFESQNLKKLLFSLL